MPCQKYLSFTYSVCLMMVSLFSDEGFGFVAVNEPSRCIDNMSFVSIFYICIFDGRKWVFSVNFSAVHTLLVI